MLLAMSLVVAVAALAPADDGTSAHPTPFGRGQSPSPTSGAHPTPSDSTPSDSTAGDPGRGDRAPAAWLQFGGPNQDFRAPAEGLATSWPEGGPQKLWSRELGEGYSAILYEAGRLYTMHRSGHQEAVICLDAKTGETIWEQRYDAVYTGRPGYGDGPRSTPLIAGDLLFAVGASGSMKALDKGDGAIFWSNELWGEEFGGNFLGHGYSSSPVAYKETVIVPVGGENAGLVAFDQQSGRVKWKALDFRNSYSSPRLVRVLDEEQLVVFMAEELIGVAPDTGELRWRYAQVNQWSQNISLPTVVDRDTIFISSPQTGARGLRLIADGEKIEVEQLWSTRRIQFYHVSSARSGDWVYGSSGTVSPAFMAAINVRTGEIGWRQRGFAKANTVEADGNLVILDEDGVLYLANPTSQGLVVLAETQLLAKWAWTAPTIVGQTLYVRDRKQIVAVNLG